jgi:endonuclease/exonuclease/phosphatase (EEP) superfamily protein YafD
MISALHANGTIQLLNTLGLWLYLPLPILLIAGVLSRRSSAWLLLFPTLVFGAEYGQLLLPKQPNPHAPQLRVMTWNLLFTNPNDSGVAAFIRHEQPDLLFVQELGWHMGLQLAEELHSSYPSQWIEPASGARGLGIFSRYPLMRVTPETERYDPCRCQHALVQIDDHQVDVLNFHPSIPAIEVFEIGRLRIPVALDTTPQLEPFDAMLKRIEPVGRPILLAGDFNLTEREPTYRRIRAKLSDAFREAGWGFGLSYPQGTQIGPVPIPNLIRIDYIFHSSDLRALAAWNGSGAGSDHRYLVADFVWQ